MFQIFPEKGPNDVNNYMKVDLSKYEFTTRELRLLHNEDLSIDDCKYVMDMPWEIVDAYRKQNKIKSTCRGWKFYTRYPDDNFVKLFLKNIHKIGKTYEITGPGRPKKTPVDSPIKIVKRHRNLTLDQFKRAIKKDKKNKTMIG